MEAEKKDQRQSQVRKPFLKPRLRIYGNISTITQSANPGSVMDHVPTQSGMRTAA
jgi:hypothetical protein